LENIQNEGVNADSADGETLNQRGVKKWKHLADENASLLDRLHASDVVEYLADALRIAKGLDQPEMKLSPS